MAQKSKPLNKAVGKSVKKLSAKGSSKAPATASKSTAKSTKGLTAPKKVAAAKPTATKSPKRPPTTAVQMTEAVPRASKGAGPAKGLIAKATIESAKSAKIPTAKAVEAPGVQPTIAKAKAALKRESTAAEAAPAGKPADVAAPKAEKKSRKKISIEIRANEAASELAAKWASLYKKAEQIEAKPYNMKAVFEEKTAIVHKVLGWGYILANRNDRLEVLFKDGIKYLISNYKP